MNPHFNRRSLLKNAFTMAALFLVLSLTSCVTPKPPEPLGPNSYRFYGSTVNQNKFDPFITERCPQDELDVGTPWRNSTTNRPMTRR